MAALVPDRPVLGPSTEKLGECEAVHAVPGGGVNAVVVRDWVNDAIRSVRIMSRVPRGFKQRLEYSDQGLDGPWEILTVLPGPDGDSTAFGQYEQSFGMRMRMYRSLPPEPLELTLPW
jgi:hypothetical protein